MIKNLSSIILIITLLTLATNQSYASQPPIGNLELANGRQISGWAFDPDYTNQIWVHIYVDNVFMTAVLANEFRSDIWDIYNRNAVFNWRHSPFGAGQHNVKVYAIGVDSQGNPDGQNTLIGEIQFNSGCQFLYGSEHEWCTNNPNYWVNRQPSTKLLIKLGITLGVNNSYGGTITQLYSNDRSVNLIEEHGGSAVQISLYGYDESSGTSPRWFRRGWCQPGIPTTAYTSQANCESQEGAGNCVIRHAGLGSHVADCINTFACNANFTDVGWPYNPIQAQGINCGWEGPSNDADFQGPLGNFGWHTILNNPINYSKSAAFQGLMIDQKVRLYDYHAQIDYTLAYSGSLNQIGIHGQEMPAFFTNYGIDHWYYYYDGNQPFTHDLSNIRRVNRPVDNLEYFLSIFPNWDGNSRGNIRIGNITEYWWGVCDQAETNCVTIATFDSMMQKAAIKNLSNAGAYIAPTAYFPIEIGMNKQATIYVFPYKWDTVLGNKSIRQRIYELNPHPPTPTQTPSPTPYPPYPNIIHYFNKPGPRPEDLNNDNKVNIFDLNLWISQ